MSRRRLVALASASVILFLALLIVAAILAITQTEFGRERVRRLINSGIASALKGHGSIYVGHLSGNLFSGVVIDSLAIRDDHDSLFLASGPVHLKYDPRDLFDKRILLSYLELDRPVVYLRRHADRSWNYQHIFPSHPPASGGGTRSSPNRAIAHAAEPSFGDFIASDSTVIHDGTFILADLWSPADYLTTRQQRDSAARAELASPEHEIRRTPEGVKQIRRWTHLEFRSPYIRIADPDSAGRVIDVGRLDVIEDDPPFRFRNVSGPVRVRGDSVWFDIHHFDLPGSTGQARGKVWWGSDLPTRYDISITADSFALADIDWVDPALPGTGGGSVKLTIRNDPHNLHILRYRLRNMDVRTTGSRLRGAMTFVVGAPVLAIDSVALDADPVDFDLLRAFNGGPFPEDWQGDFTGSVRGKGGPLNRWEVDDARLTFRDKHVPGAVSMLTAHGGLDILKPALAKFRGLDVDIQRLDLRTPRFLFPSFPRLKGTISGTARLDSIWTDLRFSNADLTHTDGPGPTSHFTGSGRVTYNPKELAFDVDLNASPVAFTTLARSYPGLMLRGSYSGPIQAAGTMSNLDLTTSLSGGAGQFSVNGHFDLAAPQLAGRGTVRFSDLDVRALSDRPTYPVTQLTGAITGDVRGDSLPNLAGALSLALGRSMVDSIAIDTSLAVLAFADGHMRVDSLHLRTNVARITAAGALGVAPGISDTLRYTATVDSLAGLRPYLAADSLGGTIESTGMLVGSIRSLAVQGSLTGSGLFGPDVLTRRVTGAYAFRGLPDAPSGSARVTFDSVEIARVRLTSAAASLAFANRSSGTAELDAVSNDPHGRFHGAATLGFERAPDGLHLVVDTADMTVREHAWSLAAPAHVLMDSTGASLDSMIVHGNGGTIALRGTFPTQGSVDVTLSADSISLADLGALAQTAEPLGGRGWLALHVTGPRTEPVIDLSGRFTGADYGDLLFPDLSIRGNYAARHLRMDLDVFRKGQTVLAATSSLPVEITLTGAPRRLLTDSLSGRIRGDSVDLTTLAALAPQLTKLAGTAFVDLALGGTWERPVLAGPVRIHNASMGLPAAGIQLRNLDADVAFAPDSIRITRLTMKSGSDPNSMLSLAGAIHVPNYRDPRKFGFDLGLRTRNFQALDKRSIGRIELSGALQLSGTFDHPTLGGTLAADRATFYISDIYQKQVVNLNDPEFYNIVDTSLVANRGLLQNLPPALDTALTNLRVPSLEVHIGDDVWLRSEEANIKLSGSMDLAKQGNQRVESGTLRVTRGTYRLDLNVVQRTFQVDSGYVTFYGDPYIPAELNVYASYVVRQANREIGQDVKIIAHIGGTMRQPQLELSSEERIPLSNTEILSYLVFGQPSIGATSDAPSNYALRQVAAALLPSVGAVLERALSDQIGFIDYVQVQTGSTTGSGDPADVASGASNALSGTRIGVGKQIGERTFITANAGLCKLAGAQSNSSFASSLGLTIEHRLNDGFSLQASSEPSSVALQCRGLPDIGYRPRQYGFDLFREWSF